MIQASLANKTTLVGVNNNDKSNDRSQSSPLFVLFHWLPGVITNATFSGAPHVGSRATVESLQVPPKCIGYAAAVEVVMDNGKPWRITCQQAIASLAAVGIRSNTYHRAESISVFHRQFRQYELFEKNTVEWNQK
eukprot:scaffold61798_cov48-Attheya_sp.AAC.1